MNALATLVEPIWKRAKISDVEYICIACGTAFATKLQRGLHKLTHDHPLTCDFEGCWVVAVSIRDLRKHQEIHERPFVCAFEGCSKRFLNTDKLDRHNQMFHRTKQLHPCEVEGCTTVCKHPRDLKKHRRIHTGERPFVCEICGMAFTEAGVLTVHRRIHTGERPYRCDVDGCGVAFRQPSDLKKHKQSIHTKEGHQRQKRKEERVARFLEAQGLRFDREATIHFCGDGNKSCARLDFVLYRDWGVAIVEVDEHQHVHYPVICETARMMDVLTEQVKVGRMDKTKFIRYNPDAFKYNFKPSRVQTTERHARLMKAIQEEPRHQFEICYMFYDQCSPLPEICLDPEYSRELRKLVTTG